MTALAKDRKTDQLGTPDIVIPQLLSFPVAATTTIYGGSLVGTNASGYAVPGSANNALRIWGRCEKQALNTVAAGVGSAGDINVEVRQGVFYFGQAGTTFTIADVSKLVYVVDDQTVSLSDGSGLRPTCGFVVNVRGDGQIGVYVGAPSLYSSSAPSTLTNAFRARGVVFANQSSLSAFTVANNGVTYVADDIVLLTNQTTAAECGPYVVGTVTTGTAPLTRPDWWYVGMAIPEGIVISVAAEGTLFAGSQWRSMAGKGKVVDTDDPNFYPKNVRGILTLASGTKTLGSAEGLFLYSVTTSTINCTMNTPGGTLTLTTGGYGSNSAGRTAGKSGTAAAIVIARVAAGTIDTANNSTVDFLVTNW